VAVSERANPSGSAFVVELQRGGDSGCLSVSGNYGDDLLARFEAELEAAKDNQIRQLIVDLHALRGADALAIDALLGRWSANHRNGVRLILVRVPGHLRASLEETGLDRLLPIAYEGRADLD
jgi:anti-anti-sigma factor